MISDRNQETAGFASLAPFAVHVFTASGAALAMLALMEAVERRWANMFLWLGIALVVDGVDGALARRFRVAERLPRWSGDALDLVVDILTYVFVPAYALSVSGLLPPMLAVLLVLLIVVTSALYFADRQMKSSDNYFMGFPAVWNLVAFYLLLLKPGPYAAAAIIILFSAATFLPVPFVHPFRVARWRALTIALMVIWLALAIFAVLRNLAPPPWASYGLAAIGLYFLVQGLARRARENIAP